MAKTVWTTSVSFVGVRIPWETNKRKLSHWFLILFRKMYISLCELIPHVSF